MAPFLLKRDVISSTTASHLHGQYYTKSPKPRQSSPLSTVTTMMDQLHGTTMIHNSRDAKEAPRNRPDSPRRRMARAHCLLAPRAYEEIYHEQAYLATYLQQKTQRIESIIQEYSQTQAQLERGAEGKTRRRLRKLLNLLRCKLDEASEQERAIFSRMGELYMELNSRDTWERTRSISTADAAAHSATTRDDAAGRSQAGGADEECGVMPGTPCPSFVSSDGSVASSAALLASPESAFAPVFVLHAGEPDGHHPYAPEYLEPVPEEMEVETNKTPAEAPMEQPEESGQWRQENRSGPEIGILECHYVHDETEQEEEDKGGEDGDEAEEGEKEEEMVEEEEEEERETSSRPSSKDRSHRFSLPVMQFTWPDA
ncbi:hypothetical protein BBO_08026 [Beauveria brongniartii RCEF 3172]|uniref:Uncharacterized protein n=1 Tax=Beauveria brongniartii RCEF 3172 TaxID=1081107 RepID=A0A166YC58_9HYPO|nr:hypothetical protein BBO_08026 [Beauveria brongniartii RCEF 3172]